MQINLMGTAYKWSDDSIEGASETVRKEGIAVRCAKGNVLVKLLNCAEGTRENEIGEFCQPNHDERNNIGEE